MAVAKLNPDELTSNPIEVMQSDGRKRRKHMKLVSESGLYKIIMRSDKSIDLPFQDWVTREVLLAIRKDGVYLSKGNAYADIIIQDAIKG